MTERVSNITDAGVRRRRIGGYVWLVVGVGGLLVMLALNEPRRLRLALIIPFVLAAVGFFQVREKTCVVLAATGTREDAERGTCPVPDPERPILRRQAAKVLVLSAIVGAVATALAWLI